MSGGPGALVVLVMATLIGLASCATGRTVNERYTDPNSGIEYTLVRYYTSERIQDESRDARGSVFYDYILPHTGNVFVALILDVLNPGQDMLSLPLSDIRLVREDGKSYEPYLFRDTGPAADSLASSFSKTALNIGPGKRRFLVVYDVPTSSVPDSVRLSGGSLPLQQ